jgi:hypothetical protein
MYSFWTGRALQFLCSERTQRSIKQNQTTNHAVTWTNGYGGNTTQRSALPSLLYK